MLKLKTFPARLVLALMCIAYLPGRAAAQSPDRLEPFEPNQNAVDSYYNNIYQKLLWRLADRPIARMVVVPPFSPEYALSVEKDAGGYQLKSNVKVAYFDAANNKRVVTDPPLFYSRKINRQLAMKIQELFDAALQQTGAPTDPGLDGVKYIFASYNERYGMRRGQTVSPAASTRPGALVQICHELIVYAKGQSNGEDSLLRNINALTDKFVSLNRPELATRQSANGSAKK